MLPPRVTTLILVNCVTIKANYIHYRMNLYETEKGAGAKSEWGPNPLVSPGANGLTFQGQSHFYKGTYKAVTPGSFCSPA